jgi:hypothetical protein
MEPKFTSKQNCPVCKHAMRDEIEAVLYRMTPENGEKVLDMLSNSFDIDLEDLQRHAMFHASMDLTTQKEETSIVRQIKMREADILAQCAKDYADTLSLVGTRIRTKARNESDKDGMDDTRFERSMTKGLVELYLGCGDNVRKTIKDITEIHQTLNGPKDDGLSGLAALAAAIAGSKQSATPDIFNQEDGED